ncbi:hypothetical protein KHM19_06510 [Leptospira borgpetersenii]|nr:hypothetical protein KHM09_12900 [Leptospira borgpetersenii]GIM21468.1 hypothetical protein KHM19_06510 [Leptospira borgpetersenii]GIM24725.1 hypothetical protein KHM25_06500 [Leptospira borgpetersenii]
MNTSKKEKSEKRMEHSNLSKIWRRAKGFEIQILLKRTGKKKTRKYTRQSRNNFFPLYKSTKEDNKTPVST